MKDEEILGTWKALNKHLLKADVAECHRLIHLELCGKLRLVYLLRIHSRLNKVRAEQERKELEARVVKADRK